MNYPLIAKLLLKLLLIILFLIITPVLYLISRLSHFLNTAGQIFDSKTLNFYLIFYIQHKISFIFLIFNLCIFLIYVEIQLVILLIYFNIIY